MSRVLNFAEEVYRDTDESGIATIDEIDRYREGRFVVSISSKRYLSQVNKIIKQHLDGEHLGDLAVVTRLDLSSNAR